MRAGAVTLVLLSVFVRACHVPRVTCYVPGAATCDVHVPRPANPATPRTAIRVSFLFSSDEYVTAPTMAQGPGTCKPL